MSAHRAILTWIVLLALTAASYATWFEAALVPSGLTGTVVLAAAALKCWLIGMRFMELEEAAWPLRWIFNAWVALVAVGLATMFWIAR